MIYFFEEILNKHSSLIQDVKFGRKINGKLPPFQIGFKKYVFFVKRKVFPPPTPQKSVCFLTKKIQDYFVPQRSVLNVGRLCSTNSIQDMSHHLNAKKSSYHKPPELQNGLFQSNRKSNSLQTVLIKYPLYLKTLKYPVG